MLFTFEDSEIEQDYLDQIDEEASRVANLLPDPDDDDEDDDDIPF